jgi:D-alanine-D-alanine ligase
LKAITLFNELTAESSPDDLDVMAEVQAVAQALIALGYQPVAVPVSLNLQKLRDQLLELHPAFVFNLVESLEGSGRFAHFVPALLDQLKIRYTGGSSSSIFLTTDKLLAKQRLREDGIGTPDWFCLSSPEPLPNFPPPYIIKPTWEDASVGIDAAAVVEDKLLLPEALRQRTKRFGECFVEAYVAGREFNISVLAGDKGPEVLPPAEIIFRDYPAGKPQIVDYAAKWDLDSFEYKNTNRSFQFEAEDAPLLARLAENALDCWRVFECRGYARVDFRVDAARPLVLEVNVNPCISPDAGFVAAAERAGLNYTQMIERIIADALRERGE